MMQMLINKIEVAEVYSPPRVTEMAHQMGLKVGWSLDITTVDVDGRNGDFNEVEMRNTAVRKLLEDEPLLLIGSPMCIAFGTMNNLNYPKMCPEEVKRRMEHGRRHLEFCAKLYAMQWRAGRYFLHEHPEGASSWHEDCIVKLFKKEGVVKVNGDQCMYSLRSRNGEYEGPARKGIGFMTNSVCISQQLDKRCPNRSGHMVHRHVILMNGRTKAAQVYFAGLCKAICVGLQEQIKMDEDGQFLLMNMGDINNTTSKELQASAEKIRKKYNSRRESGRGIRSRVG